MREQRRRGQAGEARHSARRSRSRSRGRNCAGSERDFRNRRSRSRDRHNRDIDSSRSSGLTRGWGSLLSSRLLSPDDRSGRGQSRDDHDRHRHTHDHRGQDRRDRDSNTRDEHRHSAGRRRSLSRSRDRERHHHGVASSFLHESAHAGRGGSLQSRGFGGQGAARNSSRSYNMELNKQIVRSGATRELCTLIEERVAEFNHINISTAFRKLLQASRAGMPRGVVEHSLEAL